MLTDFFQISDKGVKTLNCFLKFIDGVDSLVFYS